jgi:hypothetical protein
MYRQGTARQSADRDEHRAGHRPCLLAIED